MSKYFIFILLGLSSCQSQSLFQEYIELFEMKKPPIYITGSYITKTKKVIDKERYKDYLFNGDIGINFKGDIKVRPVYVFNIVSDGMPKRTGVVINFNYNKNNFYYLLIYYNDSIEDSLLIASSTSSGNKQEIQDCRILNNRIELIEKENKKTKTYKFSYHYNRFSLELIYGSVTE